MRGAACSGLWLWALAALNFARRRSSRPGRRILRRILQLVYGFVEPWWYIIPRNAARYREPDTTHPSHLHPPMMWMHNEER